MQLRILKAILPHYLTKVRDAEFCYQIKDLGKIREGNSRPMMAVEAILPHYLTKVRDAESYDQIIYLGKIRKGKT